MNNWNCLRFRRFSGNSHRKGEHLTTQLSRKTSQQSEKCNGRYVGMYAYSYVYCEEVRLIGRFTGSLTPGRYTLVIFTNADYVGRLG